MDALRGPSADASNGSKPGRSLPPIARLQRHVGRRIVSGFLILVPLIITFLILRFVYVYVEGLFDPIVDAYRGVEELAASWPGGAAGLPVSEVMEARPDLHLTYVESALALLGSRADR